MKFKKNNMLSEEKYTKLIESINKNGGYCPCQIKKSEDTLCKPCKMFIEQKNTGPCLCGRYIKEEV